MGGSKLKWDKINKDNLIWQRGYEYVSSEASQKDRFGMIPDYSTAPEKEQPKVVVRRTNGARAQKLRSEVRSNTTVDNLAFFQQERRLNDIIRKVQRLPKKRPDLLKSKDLLWSLVDVIKKIVELDPARKDIPMQANVLRAYERLQAIIARFN